MTDIAKLSKEGDISIIKLDDGKANAFSFDMLSTVQGFLNAVSYTHLTLPTNVQG